LGQQENKKRLCEAYSDAFNNFNTERWQDVLLYSKARGLVKVEDGQLVLSAPEEKNTEIQVYALFTFDGDFDIQADYHVLNQSESKDCRFNAGLVMQTLGDERSYKCYVTKRPQKGLFFRSRLDRFGEKNVERHKGAAAPGHGKIRIVRKDDLVFFSGWEDSKWSEIYAFNRPSTEKLRLRFKLQTGIEEAEGQACPMVVKFDNFLINSCDAIVKE
jgi:hypothetical protein